MKLCGHGQTHCFMKNFKVSPIPGGSALFQRMFTRLGCNGRPPRFRVEFYPYASLVLTIRRREEAMYVRFSDLLHRAPLAVLEGASRVAVVASLSAQGSERGGRTLPGIRAIAPDARAHHQMRSGRVRVAQADPRGQHFDLSSLFDTLNINILAELCSVRTLDGAREAGGGNSGATIRGRTRFC